MREHIECQGDFVFWASNQTVRTKVKYRCSYGVYLNPAQHVCVRSISIFLFLPSECASR